MCVLYMVTSSHRPLCRQVFPLFRALGADGLLIEYEDMFPYEGHLRLLRAPHAYRCLPGGWSPGDAGGAGEDFPWLDNLSVFLNASLEL